MAGMMGQFILLTRRQIKPGGAPKRSFVSYQPNVRFGSGAAIGLTGRMKPPLTERPRGESRPTHSRAKAGAAGNRAQTASIISIGSTMPAAKHKITVRRRLVCQDM